ncbi:Protein of unknown function [Amycolatopsis pretoriensis]|uniref:DUF2637 domain-containing protein n=1 Tax=Amycolatopsis pretoriensis TaxID=218821 RepID=A0A1H5RJA7_9PSEU|nr:DUF2637 domain-containing protein [Amycolatopsis pretoriensis]SEF38429.1 Protein of unknown function [Amycolatopsis pretoriensis]
MTNSSRDDLALGIQCVCTGLVALGAAFASYRHGFQFALRFGADRTTAAIWPLIVDGLLTIATVELWKSGTGSRWQAWLAFTFGISLSLCANIGSATELNVFGITVAACPPLALLLAVELLNRALKRHRATPKPATLDHTAEVSPDESSPDEPAEQTAEQRMWAYYEAERRQGRTPSGADLDRNAGTHNYGRRILRKWRSAGRLAGQSQAIESSMPFSPESFREDVGGHR